MNHRLAELVLTIALLSAAAGPASAFFVDEAKGARPAGMGEAFVAVADDVNTVLYNPAGLSRLCRVQVAGMFADLYSGLNPLLYTDAYDRIGYNFLAASAPLPGQIGTVALSWVQLDTTFYEENVFALSYARRLFQPYKLDIGASVKWMTWGVSGSDFTEDMSRQNATVDLGLLATFWQNIHVGVSMENLVPSDLGVDDPDYSPFNLRAGISGRWLTDNPYIDSIQPQIEMLFRNVRYENHNYNTKLGIETWHFNRLIALRLGVNMEVFSSGFSLHFSPLDQPLDIQLDYAFTYPFYIQYNSGSHRVGMTIEYGDCRPATATPTPSPTATPTPTATPETAQELEQKLEEVREKINLGELKPIYFDSARSTIKEISLPTLDYLGSILADYPDLKITIEGHTDSMGGAEYNKNLSQSRVESAKAYLVTRFGIIDANIVPIGYGEEKPIADNTTAEGRAINRRVEFHVIEDGQKTTTVVLATETPTPDITPTPTAGPDPETP